MVSGRRLRVLSGILPALWLLCLCLRHGATAPVKADCPCTDPSQCELITTPPRKELFAFVVEDSNWQKYDWSKITTVGMFIKYDPKLMCHAHSKGARIVLAVVYPAANLTNPAARTAWIQQQVAQAKSWHMDGVNFDIEYEVSTEHAHYVVDLVKETAQAFKAYNPNAQITFDIAGVPDCFVLGRCYDYTALAEACDFLFLMDYDFLAAGPVALPNSPLSIIKFGVDLLKVVYGVPSSKMVLGVPWYGYDCPCVELLPDDVCLVNRTLTLSKPGVGSGSVTQIQYKDIMKLLPKSSTGRLFSELFQSPYFNYKDASGQTHQLWYDDPASLALRYDYARAEDLRGVGNWEADSLDYSNDPLAMNQTKAMWDAIDKF